MHSFSVAHGLPRPCMVGRVYRALDGQKWLCGSDHEYKLLAPHSFQLVNLGPYGGLHYWVSVRSGPWHFLALTVAALSLYELCSPGAMRASGK